MKHILIIILAMTITLAGFAQKVPITDQVTLTGTGTDADGSIVSYAWKQVAGPANPTIVSADKPVTLVKDFNTAGLYKFQLTVTDNQGATGTFAIEVTVLPANLPPVAKITVDNAVIQLPK